MKKLLIVIMMLSVAAPLWASDDERTKAKIEAAMKAEVRGAADTDRDRNRRPMETLAFFGFRDDMKVVELMPGGGWYSKILAPVLAEEGEYFAAVGTGRVKSNLAGQPGFEAMNLTAEDARLFRPEGSRFYMVEMEGLGVKNADMVLTFRNYHNFAPEGRAALNKAVHEALKPGGIYAVVDHTRRHMESESGENRRRVDPVLVIKEIQDAGFRLVDYSTLHYRADDELRYEVGRRSVTGNTDRFALKFVKE